MVYTIIYTNSGHTLLGMCAFADSHFESRYMYVTDYYVFHEPSSFRL